MRQNAGCDNPKKRNRWQKGLRKQNTNQRRTEREEHENESARNRTNQTKREGNQLGPPSTRNTRKQSVADGVGDRHEPEHQHNRGIKDTYFIRNCEKPENEHACAKTDSNPDSRKMKLHPVTKDPLDIRRNGQLPNFPEMPSQVPNTKTDHDAVPDCKSEDRPIHSEFQIPNEKRNREYANETPKYRKNRDTGKPPKRRKLMLDRARKRHDRNHQQHHLKRLQWRFLKEGGIAVDERQRECTDKSASGYAYRERARNTLRNIHFLDQHKILASLYGARRRNQAEQTSECQANSIASPTLWKEHMREQRSIEKTKNNKKDLRQN